MYPPRQLHIPKAHWPICIMVTSEEGRKSHDINACIDSPDFNNGNLIVPEAPSPCGGVIFSLLTCSTPATDRAWFMSLMATRSPDPGRHLQLNKNRREAVLHYIYIWGGQRCTCHTQGEKWKAGGAKMRWESAARWSEAKRRRQGKGWSIKRKRMYEIESMSQQIVWTKIWETPS